MCLFFLKYFVWPLVNHHAELHDGDYGEKAFPAQLKIMTKGVAHGGKLLYLGVNALMACV